MQLVLDDWSLPVWLHVVDRPSLALVYLRGWFALRRTRPYQFTSGRMACYMAGLASLWLAICSPLDAFADVLLSAHMVEHLVLMSFVPPLVLLGLPVVPLLRGVPAPLRKRISSPMLRFRPLRSFLHWLVQTPVAWLAMNITLLAWHVPAAYDFCTGT